MSKSETEDFYGCLNPQCPWNDVGRYEGHRCPKCGGAIAPVDIRKRPGKPKEEEEEKTMESNDIIQGLRALLPEREKIKDLLKRLEAGEFKHLEAELKTTDSNYYGINLDSSTIKHFDTEKFYRRAKPVIVDMLELALDEVETKIADIKKHI